MLKKETKYLILNLATSSHFIDKRNLVLSDVSRTSSTFIDSRRIGRGPSPTTWEVFVIKFIG